MCCHPYPPHPERRQYAETREIFDAGEACSMGELGWKVVELITVERWAGEYHSKSTSYVMGLPRPEVAHAA